MPPAPTAPTATQTAAISGAQTVVVSTKQKVKTIQTAARLSKKRVTIALTRLLHDTSLIHNRHVRRASPAQIRQQLAAVRAFKPSTATNLTDPIRLL
jgi:hypothetical protein